MGQADSRRGGRHLRGGGGAEGALVGAVEGLPGVVVRRRVRARAEEPVVAGGAGAGLDLDGARVAVAEVRLALPRGSG